MKVAVVTRLKPGVTSSLAKMHTKDMQDFGLKTAKVSVGRYFELVVETEDQKEAIRIATEAAEKLLANKTIEDYTIEIIKGLK